MTTADALLPQRPGGIGPGAALSLVVHVGLIAALTLGVGWRMSAPEVVSAELWSALPQVAAPRVEEPPAPAPAPKPAPPPPKETAPPAVPDAKIAIEREKKAREEKEKAEAAEKKKREAEDKKREQAAKAAELQAQKAEAARLEKLREEQMKRMLGTLQGSGAPTSTGSAAADAAPSASYAGKLVALLRDNINYPGSGNPTTIVEVRAASGGTVVSRRVVKPSGVPEYDDAVLRAIDRIGTLPRDTDGRVPPTIIITFKRNE